MIFFQSLKEFNFNLELMEASALKTVCEALDFNTSVAVIVVSSVASIANRWFVGLFMQLITAYRAVVRPKHTRYETGLNTSHISK